MRYARSKNLTPYDVLIIASMIEREVFVPRERKLVAAVVYNRLRAGMPLQIDATLRYGLDIPPTEPITKEHLRSDSPYNTSHQDGVAADADREPGPGVDAGGGASGEGRLHLLRAQAGLP